ncbi:hypothetical protein [Streptomyces sp. NPDC048445]|uniref:hypothetical protein n=1 Tax=Streptomyces sp. NPDC048445 TaxID=3365553 RepID=UPI00371E5A8A
MEVALVRLATTVLAAVAKSLLAPKPGAGLVPDPVRTLPRPAKPDRLAKVLGGRLEASYAGLPEHERLAAVEAVKDAFAAAGALTAALVGGDAAYEVVKRYRDDERDAVAAQLANAWGSFHTKLYAREVLAARPWSRFHVSAATAEQMAALRYVPEALAIRLQGAHADLSPLVLRHGMEKLFVFDNKDLTDITPLASMHSLTELGLSLCPEVRDLSPLAGLPLTWLTLNRLHPDVAAEQLEPFTGVHTLTLGHRFQARGIGELPLGQSIRSLSLCWEAEDLSLEGLGQWTELEQIGLRSLTQLQQLCRTRSFVRLQRLSLELMDGLDLAVLTGPASLRTLTLSRCHLQRGLEPLRLPALTHLTLYAQPEADPYDLTPLADLDALTITLGSDTPTIGNDLFPPERIIRLR